MANTEINAQEGNSWTGKTYNITGSWKITNEGSFLIGNDFSTSAGPDLKLYLVSGNLDTIGNRDKVGNDWVYLGELRSNKGAQAYQIPEEINIEEYQSIIVHCTAYAVVWGGINLHAK
ncbi:DM13 domain-containing protein [Galbibacter mesophilus]|uniref:DM13 domain-containing protein n=1 Tax=Galbibacter mesophilus TaxID=379069 RepID=UPI001F5C20D0|nr:DM13 domain-containing protein [Galbibacter mesophilus]MCM5663855.1 DM13 domain-containing protein [Galbibacter mesophilus]